MMASWMGVKPGGGDQDSEASSGVVRSGESSRDVGDWRSMSMEEGSGGFVTNTVEAMVM